MNQLQRIEIEIEKEKACIKDLLHVICKHMEDGEYDLATMRELDVRKSIENVKKLDEKKRFYVIAIDLMRDGITAKVVKRYANQN